MATPTAEGDGTASAGAPEQPDDDLLGVRRITGFGDAGLAAEWEKYCGHLNFTVREFMDVQERLLQEQVHLIGETAVGRKMFKGRMPRNVAEFRDFVPLTTYGDYVPFLENRDDAVLDGSRHTWAHTTGAQAGYKYVPYTVRGIERLLDMLMSAFILASAHRRGDVNVRPGDTVLYNTPERPYVSGLATFGMRERFGFRPVLSPEASEHMEFKERIRAGFRAALGKQVDVIISMTSVLNTIGQGFADQSRSTSFDRSMLRPRALSRVLRTLVKRKLLRQTVLPKDLWPTKAIIGWGIDTSVFRGAVERYWGRAPFEIYACTEGGVMATETWERHGMIFTPYSDFLEFIPMEESLRSREDERFTPRTVLMDEVEPGKSYEVVITNFYGMAFLRYRVGHYVRFLPLKEQSKTFELPQFAFEGRADDRIDLAGFTRLDAKTIWESLGVAEFDYHDWTARKEFEEDRPMLHIYLELRQPVDEAGVVTKMDEAIRSIDPFYGDLESMLGILPLKVTLLSAGTFNRFYDARRDEGYLLEMRTPPKMNTSDQDIADLLRANEAGA